MTNSPSLQKRAFSKIEHSSLSIYEKARIKLHVANTPDCLPCRDKQFSDIYNFIETNLKNQTGGYLILYLLFYSQVKINFNSFTI
jgi:origin recognition complex subunit 1